MKSRWDAHQVPGPFDTDVEDLPEDEEIEEDWDDEIGDEPPEDPDAD